LTVERSLDKGTKLLGGVIVLIVGGDIPGGIFGDELGMMVVGRVEG
jgi:hypothetical protein